MDLTEYVWWVNLRQDVILQCKKLYIYYETIIIVMVNYLQDGWMVTYAFMWFVPRWEAYKPKPILIANQMKWYTWMSNRLTF